MSDEKRECPPHHWLVTIAQNPSMGRVYRHVCKRCKTRRDQPIHEQPTRWRPRAK